MRFTWLYLAFSIALFSGITVNGERYAVLPRQNSNPSPSSSAASTAPTSSATASTSSHDSAQSSNGGTSTSASGSSGPSNTPSSASQAAATTLSTSASGKTPPPTSETTSVVSATPIANITSPLLTNGKISTKHLRPTEMAKLVDTAKGDPQALPIPPRITPALSVAGAILMATGVFYTLMGIRTKW